MDKLIAVEEFFVDSPAATSNAIENADIEVNAEKYRKFLHINPIWSYMGLSKQEYFKLSIEEKTSHIHKYYKHMLNGKNRFFFYLFADFYIS